MKSETGRKTGSFQMVSKTLCVTAHFRSAKKQIHKIIEGNRCLFAFEYSEQRVIDLFNPRVVWHLQPNLCENWKCPSGVLCRFEWDLECARKSLDRLDPIKLNSWLHIKNCCISAFAIGSRSALCANLWFVFVQLTHRFNIRRRRRRRQ